MQFNYKVGFDSFRFVLPRKSFYKFLHKNALFSKLRKTTRNKQINEYVKFKFKGVKTKDEKYPFNMRYINLKARNKSLSNTILVLDNSKLCHALSKRYKKKKDFYIEVQFNGLHQPSKDIDGAVFKVLSKMIKRFKVYSVDISSDFNLNKHTNENYKNEFLELLKKLKTAGSFNAVYNSLYINAVKSRYYNLERILLYDKFDKQTNYHKEKINANFKDWKRIELSFKIKGKFLEHIENAEVESALCFLQDFLGLLEIADFNLDFICAQTQLLNNPRHAKDFKAYIKEVA